MANPFPFNNWEDVTLADWEPKIVDWFCDNYGGDARGTMSQLLDHVFQVTENVGASDFRLDKVMKLGQELQNHIPESSIFDVREGHDRRILILLELGLPLRSARLFMAPEINKDNLLNLDGYSILFLGIKYYAAGDYATSARLLELVARECTLAKYVIGQDDRRINRFESAHNWIDRCIKGIEGWGNHSCLFNRGQNIICNKPLIEAEAFRAKGVVFRRQGRREEARDAFSQALSAVEEAINTRSDDDELLASYNRVKADVCYSYGYCFYEERDYENAEDLFRQAIGALNDANQEWDAPYTRLAVIQLCRGQKDLAVETFIKAHEICRMTPIEQNREAPLSKSLCSIGLQVIDLCYPGRGRGFVAIGHPMDDLENALNLTPKLNLGPLECHKEDAEHLLIDRLKRAEGLVNRFIDRLEEAIEKVEPTPSSLKENPRILFLGASPYDQNLIRLNAEVNAIQEGLRQARYGNRFEFYQRSDIDFDHLSESLLQYEPHIVHISAHVDNEGNIILVDDLGCSKEVSPDRLGAQLGNFNDYIRCVVLAGCNSERTVKAIQPYVEPIVAMSRPVRDSVCIDFSRQFYRALGSGRKVQSAFDIGRAAMDHPNWKNLANLFWQWNNPRRIRFV